MSYPITLSQGWSRLASEIDAEIKRARAKFPEPGLLTTALTEEHGEAIRAVLEHYYLMRRGGSGTPGDLKRARDEVRKELIQTAAMCVRLALEGDPVHLLTSEAE